MPLTSIGEPCCELRSSQVRTAGTTLIRWQDVAMGWRSVFVSFDRAPSDAVLEWVKQFCACAEWYGAGPGSELREEDEGHLLEIQLDANSSHLNSCTPPLCEAATKIARDIDPEDSDLAELAALVAQQLTEQVVPHDPDRIVTFTRPGREASERLGGKASVPVLLQELALHQSRVLNDLDAIATASGPAAWRARLACYDANLCSILSEPGRARMARPVRSKGRTWKTMNPFAFVSRPSCMSRVCRLPSTPPPSAASPRCWAPRMGGSGKGAWL